MPNDPTPVGGEVLVNTTTLNDQNWSRVAALAGGGHVVIWHSFAQDGSGLGVYSQRYDAAGVPIGGEVQVNSTTVDDQVCPVVAALAGGGYVVAWFSSNQDGSGDGIFARRYDAAGAPQGGEAQVNTYTPNHQQSASIVGLADGGYVIAWQSIGQDGAAHGVYAQRYDAAGLPQGGEFLVNTTTTSIERDPSVAALADGGYVIAWHAFGQDGSDFGIFAQRYDESGVPQGGEAQVNTTTASTQRTPVVAGLPDGGYVVVWWSLNQDGSGFGIFEQRYDASGVPQGGEVQVNTTTAGEQQDAWVAALADGGHIVAWSSHDDGSGRGVFAQRYDASGVPQGGEVQVNTTAVTQTRDAHVAGYAAGGYIIVWSSLDQDGSGFGVYAQRYGVAAINGTEGDDFLVGTPDDDTIYGFGGNDTIEGRGDDDHIEGGDGYDFLSGQQDNDTLLGGDGHDLLRGGSGDDVIDGGDGFDRVSHAPTLPDTPPGGVTVSLLLQGVAQNTGHGWDTLIGIESLSGTEFDDVLTGDEEDNWLWTGHGLTGFTGNDTISGNGGDDLIQASPGNHVLDGGAGTDSLSLYDNGAEVSFAGASVSLLLQGAAQDTRQGMMLLDGFENLSGTTFDDTLTGDGGGNVLAGSLGDDALSGGAGDDVLLGDGMIAPDTGAFGTAGPTIIIEDLAFSEGGVPGDDTLVGGKGDDILDGGGGSDILSGGQGRDVFDFGPASGHDRITDFTNSQDRIRFESDSGATGFSDLIISQAGKDVLISWGGGSASIRLEKTKGHQIDSSDFLFGEEAAAFAAVTMAEFGRDSNWLIPPPIA